VADVVFVVDSSGSIRDANPADGSYDNWDIIIGFIHAMIDHFDIGFDNTRFGLVDFSYDATNVFYLGSFYTSDEIKAAVSSMIYYGSYTNTPAGIRNMRDV